MALSSQQLAGLNIAAQRQAQGNASAEDLKNLQYAQKTFGYKAPTSMPSVPSSTPAPTVQQPKAPTPPPVSTSQSVAGPISSPIRPPASSSAVYSQPPIPQTPPSTSTQVQVAQPYRPPEQAQQQSVADYVPPKVTPQTGQVQIMRGEDAGDFEGIVTQSSNVPGVPSISYGYRIPKATVINAQGERVIVRTDKKRGGKYQTAEDLFAKGYRLEKAPGIPVTPFGTENVQTGARTGVSTGAVQLQAPNSANTFRDFLVKQLRAPAEIDKTIQELNIAASRDAAGVASATDNANLAYAESRGYIRPQVTQQAQAEALQRSVEPSAPSEPEAPPSTDVTQDAPDTLPAGAFGEAETAQAPMREAPMEQRSQTSYQQPAELSRAIQDQQEALRALIAAMEEGKDTSSYETGLQSAQKQLADEDLRTQMGIAAVQDQPIAAPFLQGQAAAIQRQAGIRQQGVANQANLLQQQLAAEQARRQRNVQIAQQRYEIASGLAESAKKQYAPMEVGGALIRLNPATGGYERVYGEQEAPKVEAREINGVLYERSSDGVWKKVAGEAKPAATEIREAGGVIYERGANGVWKKVAGEQKAITPDSKEVGGFIYERQADGTWAKVAGEGTNIGGYSKEQFSRLNIIADNARQDENLKTFPSVRASYETARTAATRGDGAGDIVLMRMLAKITDPTTGVKEEEFRTFEGAQGALDRLGIKLDRGMWEGDKLNKQGRERLLREAEAIYSQRQAAYRNSYNFYVGQAQNVGGTEKDVLPYYVAPSTGSTSQPPTQGETFQDFMTRKQAEMRMSIDPRSSTYKALEREYNQNSAINTLPSADDFRQESQTSSNGIIKTSTSTDGHDINRLVAAIGQFESGGNYGALGKTTATGDRAYGKYQVMGNNIPSWTQEVLGRRMTPQEFLKDKKAQDQVASAKLGQSLAKYGNIEDAASVWFSGRPVKLAGNARDVVGTSVPQYISNIRALYNRKNTSIA